MWFRKAFRVLLYEYGNPMSFFVAPFAGRVVVSCSVVPTELALANSFYLQVFCV